MALSVLALDPAVADPLAAAVSGSDGSNETQAVFSTADNQFVPGFDNQGYIYGDTNGFWRERGAYEVGWGEDCDDYEWSANNFFSFDVSELHPRSVTKAALVLRRGKTHHGGTLTLRAIEISAETLHLGNEWDVRGSLYSGQEYGRHRLTDSADPDATVRLPLNDSAIEAINDAARGWFSISGALSDSPTGCGRHSLFTATSNEGRQDLVVTVTSNTVIGTPSNDALTGTAVADLVGGRIGDDVLHGLAGGDAMYGGIGDDVLHGRRGDDRLHAGAGKDDLRGGSGADYLIMEGSGPDRASGGPQPDRIYAGEDDARLYGGRGRDQLHVGGPAHFSVHGSRGADGFDVRRAPNARLHGGPGGDRFVVQGHAAVLFGGAGDDVIRSRRTARVGGGAGNDRIVVDGGYSNVVDCGPGNDVVLADSHDVLTNCEVTS